MGVRLPHECQILPARFSASPRWKVSLSRESALSHLPRSRSHYRSRSRYRVRVRGRVRIRIGGQVRLPLCCERARLMNANPSG